jgi:dnd system-associated protein 4
MRKQSLFTKERVIYWSDEFADVVNQLTGKDADGKIVQPAIYSFNTGAIVLAAAVGVAQKRKRELGSGGRREISTTTFASHGLEMYIFLIALLGGSFESVEIFRPDNEELLIKEFEQYASGGLEYLRSEFSQAPMKTADWIVEKLFLVKDKTGIEADIPILI